MSSASLASNSLAFSNSFSAATLLDFSVSNSFLTSLFLAFSVSNFLVTFSVLSISSLISLAFVCLVSKFLDFSLTEVLAFSNSVSLVAFPVFDLSNSDLVWSSTLALSVSDFSAFSTFSFVASLPFSTSLVILSTSFVALPSSDDFEFTSFSFCVFVTLVVVTFSFAFATSCSVVLPLTSATLSSGVSVVGFSAACASIPPVARVAPAIAVVNTIVVLSFLFILFISNHM